MIERAAVTSLPVVLQLGWAPSVLLFDQVVVADSNYVGTALAEIDDPSALASSYDPSGEQTVAEVRLGLGYHVGAPRHTLEPFADARAALDELAVLRDRGLGAAPPAAARTSRVFQNSFRAADAMNQLDEERLASAIAMARGQPVEVYTMTAPEQVTGLTHVAPERSSDLLVRAVLEAVPVPSRRVPLDDLLAFREDPEVATQLARLRIWIRQVVQKADTLGEFADELMVARSELEKSARRLDREYDRTTLGIVAQLLTETADNLARLKVGSAVKGLLSWQKVALERQEAEEELSADPVALLRKMERAFSQDG